MPARKYQIARLAGAYVLDEGSALLRWHEPIAFGADVEHRATDILEGHAPVADLQTALRELRVGVYVLHDFAEQTSGQRHIAAEPPLEPALNLRLLIAARLSELSFAELLCEIRGKLVRI